MDKVTENAINKCLKEIKKGERESVNTLYDLIAPYIRYIALQYTDDNNIFDADDLVQDFWRDIFKIAAKFVAGRNGYAFLCGIMQKRARDFNRKHNNRSAVSLRYIDFAALSYDDENVDFALAELKHVVGKAIDELPENEKTVLQLSYFMNMSVREIAHELNIPKSTVGRLKIAAENALRKKLAYLFPDSSDNDDR